MRAVLTQWQHMGEGGHADILPDGCQDLIGTQLPGQPVQWFVTPLSDSRYCASTPTNLRFAGYRFRPGAQIRCDVLLAHVARIELDDVASCLAACDDAVTVDCRLDEALQAIAAFPSLATARRHLGIGERTLQRLVLSRTSRTPLYWRRLARWRSAMRRLANQEPLAELAQDLGYADQAHMNLDFRQWIGMSPLRVRQMPHLVHLAHATGHG